MIAVAHPVSLELTVCLCYCQLSWVKSGSLVWVMVVIDNRAVETSWELKTPKPCGGVEGYKAEKWSSQIGKYC